MRRAANKYGIENFEVRILDYHVKTDKDLNYLERKYIAQYKTLASQSGGYNLTSGGNSNKTVSKATRKKLSENQVGKRLSPECIAQIVNARKIPVNQLNRKTKELIKKWESARDAEKNLSIWKGNITKACRKDLKSAGGFCWEYV